MKEKNKMNQPELFEEKELKACQDSQEGAQPLLGGFFAREVYTTPTKATITYYRGSDEEGKN